MAAMLFPPNLSQTPPNAPKRPLSLWERAGVRVSPTPKLPPKRKGETLRPPLEFVVLSHRS